MALVSAGLRGYRLNWEGVPGRPDIAFLAEGLAVFVHGCYWHRCPRCDLPLPKKNRRFWDLKFQRNVSRDRRKIERLENLEWDVLVLWECEVNDSVSGCVTRVLERLSRSNAVPRQRGVRPYTAEARRTSRFSADGASD